MGRHLPKWGWVDGRMGRVQFPARGRGQMVIKLFSMLDQAAAKAALDGDEAVFDGAQAVLDA